MSKTKQTQTQLDPLAPTKTKTSDMCLTAIKALLKEGNGKFSFRALSDKVGGPRRARHAVWVARYAGIKLSAIRTGRVVESYQHLVTADRPQTKSIPTAYKPHWNAVKARASQEPDRKPAAPAVAKAAAADKQLVNA